ncbi:MAG: YihY/virulence factor BrkB family protein [Alphaproteobacteria bacterium]|nr:YihY/virulence factor BrkB family protein [Alphaproteobacteria bacterium]
MARPRGTARPLLSLVAVAVAVLLLSLAHDEARRRRSPAIATPRPVPPPATGWRPVLGRVWSEIFADRVFAEAAGVAFYVLLAMFPTLAAVVSLYGLVADRSTIGQHLVLLSFFLPAGAVDIVADQASRIAARPAETLGLTLLAGLAASLWSANAGMKALLDALNIAYDEPERRGLVALNLHSMAFTLGAIAFLLAALAAVVALPMMLTLVGLEAATERLLYLARWPALALALLGGLTALYRWGPSRPPSRRRWLGWGPPVAAAGWLAVSLLLSWYIAGFGNYDETYGSLGAAIGFMTWIWLSAVAILVGAEVDSETRPAHG